ncbi:MAG: hypothetical protein C0594_04535 [Marinilabiliales bacterium]|nr:MAG: hypothetical protein C0594_04535 [Marinilabiliales bacterium]
MKANYICPDCKGQLLVADKICFAARKPNKDAGLIFLSPEIGDYSVISHQDFRLEEGEKLEIFCPICHANLVADDVNKNLAAVQVVDNGGNESKILFSEIVGQRCTYKITESNIEAYGDDLEEYTNFFGEVPKY